jgi:hypothetical protein
MDVLTKSAEVYCLSADGRSMNIQLPRLQSMTGKDEAMNQTGFS